MSDTPEVAPQPENPPLTVVQIQEKARKIIEVSPDGMRLKDIVAEIKMSSPETNENTIRGAIAQLRQDEKFLQSVDTSNWGLYKPKQHDESKDDADEPVDDTSTSELGDGIKESDFYDPFAEFLVTDQVCTVAASIGGMIGGGRWGNPDVVGCIKPLPDYVVRFDPEIVTAEIKLATDREGVFKGFGQALSYQVFSHKVYLVLPKDVKGGLKNELSIRCDFHGLGLVWFDSKDKNTTWEVEFKPRKVNPDMIQLNEFAEKIKNYNSKIFRNLF